MSRSVHWFKHHIVIPAQAGIQCCLTRHPEQSEGSPRVFLYFAFLVFRDSAMDSCLSRNDVEAHKDLLGFSDMVTLFEEIFEVSLS
jgi:hypothetical protein